MHLIPSMLLFRINSFVALVYLASFALSMSIERSRKKTFCNNLCDHFINKILSEVDTCFHNACFKNLDLLKFYESKSGWSWCGRAMYSLKLGWFKCDDNNLLPGRYPHHWE